MKAVDLQGGLFMVNPDLNPLILCLGLAQPGFSWGGWGGGGTGVASVRSS